MNRKTLDIATLVIAALGACMGLAYMTVPGYENIGMFLMGGAVAAALLTILIPTRNTEKKGGSS